MCILKQVLQIFLFLTLVLPTFAFSSNLGTIDFEGDLSLDFNTLTFYKNLNDNSESLIFNEANYFSNELLSKHDNKAFFENFEQLVRIPFAEVLPTIEEMAAKFLAQKKEHDKES